MLVAAQTEAVWLLTVSWRAYTTCQLRGSLPVSSGTYGVTQVALE